MRIVDTARLWFREGKSDKVYEIDLVEVADGQYVVNFRYGRRGSPLRDGTKTPVPVPLDKARGIYAALVAEKVKGGYQGTEGAESEAAAARPAAGSESKRGSREARANAWLLAALAKGLRSEEPVHLVVRKVGERGLRDAEPLLLELLAAGKPPQGMKPAVFGHFVVSALARCGSTAALGRLTDIADGKIYPLHLRHVARLALVMIEGEKQRDRVRALIPAELRPAATSDASAQARALETLTISKKQEGHAATFALYLLASSGSDAEAAAARRLVLSAVRVLRLSFEDRSIARTLTWAAELRRDGELFALLARRFEQISGSRYNLTSGYFRRRAARVLRRLGRLGSPDYVAMASELLLSYRDADAEPVVVSSVWSEEAEGEREVRWDAFGRYHALNFVLYGHSPRYEKAGHQRATWRCKGRYRPGGPPPAKREESFPELWDRAPEALWRIASSPAATPVIQFATRALRDHPALLRGLSDQVLAEAMATMHPLTRQLAFETARSRPLTAMLAKGALAAGIDEADQWVLAWIAAQPSVLADAELVVALVLARSASVREAGTRHARAQRFTDEVARDIVLRSLAGLLALPALAGSEERAQSAAAFLLEAFPALLGVLGEKVLNDLLEHPVSGVRSLGARILAQTPVEVMKDAPDLLIHFALSANAELREGTRGLLGEVARLHPSVGQTVAARLLAALREAQPQGAPAHVVSLLRKELASVLPRLDAREVMALLGALSPHAREAGGLLLAHLGPDDLGLQDIVKLASHELLLVRRGAWQLASKARERFALAPVALARLCDAKWEDSRVFAFELVRSYSPSVLVPDVVIAICDSVLPEVQRFGQGLMQEHWDDRHASRYLLRLSEHPSTNIQLLVSGLLERHARGNLPELLPYLATVLSQVNRGAVAKQRVLAFLRAEAAASAETAALLAPLLDRQSATSAVTHKAPLIATMVEVRDKHPEVPLPIAVHTPKAHTRSSRGV